MARGSTWKQVVAADVVPDFPLYNENDLRQLILGSYQLPYPWPSIIFKNTLTQIRDSIFLLVMVFLD